MQLKQSKYFVIKVRHRFYITEGIEKLVEKKLVDWHSNHGKSLEGSRL